MYTRDFDYPLPPELIADEPRERGASRLLVVAGEETRHRRIADLPHLLRPGDLLVVNNTRVLPARLFGRRTASGGRVEVLLVEKTGPLTWQAMLRPGRRMTAGVELRMEGGLTATVVVAP
ncbi:MAG: S-adenosylmethionine:tRNA ribosyltransferase-isomerase, partial [Thermoanaerobaculia bacterium]|nr:S-adenosylmethionine:tRNA ribosyltransferase-isomerase [Thermoanaerobaculia bacterium]